MKKIGSIKYDCKYKKIVLIFRTLIVSHFKLIIKFISVKIQKKKKTEDKFSLRLQLIIDILFKFTCNVSSDLKVTYNL